MGLVLLRAAVGLTLIAQGTAHVTGAVEMTPTAIINDVIAVVIGGALMLVFLTPVAGTAAAVFSFMTALTWLPSGAVTRIGRAPGCRSVLGVAMSSTSETRRPHGRATAGVALRHRPCAPTLPTSPDTRRGRVNQTP